jgi:hypothetical protein
MVWFAALVHWDDQFFFALAPIYALIFIAWSIALDRYRRSIKIEYILEGTATTVAKVLKETFGDLQGCRAVWQINAQGHTFDWKRNAGATTIANRKQIYPKTVKPPFIRCNVTFPSLYFSNGSLYFLPDSVLFATKASITAITYQDLITSNRAVRFIEDGSAPSDTTVVGNTWRFVNKSGGPDRRFNFNKQLPICLYGEMDFRSEGGLNLKIEYSRSSACERFQKAIDILHRPESLLDSKPISRFQKSKRWPTLLFGGLFLLAVSIPLAASQIWGTNLGNFLKSQSTTNIQIDQNSAKKDSFSPVKSVQKPKRNHSTSMPLDIMPDGLTHGLR